MRTLLILLFSASLHAELQSVTLQFNTVSCTRSCHDLLAKQLRRIGGVQNVEINPSQGLINLSYAPGVPFSFPPINTAVRVAGPNLEWIQLSVRGRVEVSGNRATLISLGDNSHFEILSPGGPPGNGRYVEFNSANHVLNPTQIAQLSELAKAKETVVITGPLFQPERSPPYRLIMLTMTADQKK